MHGEQQEMGASGRERNTDEGWPRAGRAGRRQDWAQECSANGYVFSCFSFMLYSLLSLHNPGGPP